MSDKVNKYRQQLFGSKFKSKEVVDKKVKSEEKKEEHKEPVHVKEPVPNIKKNTTNTNVEKNIDLKKVNSLLRPEYRQTANTIDSLDDNLDNQIILSDFYPHYVNYRKALKKNYLSIEEVTQRLLLRQDSMLPKDETDKEFKKSLKKRSYNMPTYLLDALKELINFIDKSSFGNSKYSSINELFDVLNSGSENNPTFRYAYNYSKIISCLIWGTFKPDQELQWDILNKITRNNVELRQLIVSGTITFDSTLENNPSNLSYAPTVNYIPVLNLATLEQIKKELLQKYDLKNGQHQLYESLKEEEITQWSGGTIIEFLTNVSNSKSLFMNKLQFALFDKVMEGGQK